MHEDETNVTFSAPSVHHLELQLSTELKHINLWLKANKLSLNVARTKLMTISSRQKLQTLNDYTININVDGVQVNQTTHSNSLDLAWFDLTWLFVLRMR